MGASACTDTIGAHIVLDELNHRFLNSLQIISTLAAGVSRENGPEARTRLGRLQNVIAALGRLHRILASPVQNLAPTVEEVCSALTEALGRHVRLTLDIHAEPADSRMRRGLILVLVELLTNALKHGSADATLEVEVNLQRNAVGWWLSVASNTDGQEATPPRVAAELAAWLGGELRVKSAMPYTVDICISDRAAISPTQLH